MIKEADEKYYFDGELGAVYSPEATEFRLWSPFAEAVSLNVYPDCVGRAASDVVPMTKGEDGVWRVRCEGDLDAVFYTYSVTFDGETTETIDIYAKAGGVNGNRGQVVNFAKTNPIGWGTRHAKPLERYTDAVIYETHVRDFSSDKESMFTHKGKFLAFTERGMVNRWGDKIGIDHLVELGVTHVHLLPVFDFLTVDESEQHSPLYNWGYDPKNFNFPEGSYSTDPYDGKTRIVELKRLIHALHTEGIAVVMDVVYNHTYQTLDSAFTASFPRYYYRNFGEYYSNGSGCGNDLATERLMVRKFIVDSLVFWTKEYHIDGFRFDLMGLYDIETMNIIHRTLKEINPNVILYGEGWTGGDTPLEWEKRAMKHNAVHMKNVAFFSDDFRDTVKGNVFENRMKGYVNGAPNNAEAAMQIITGRTRHPQLPILDRYAWTDTPAQVVNYVEAHDNLTLWDKLFYTNPTDNEENRIKMDKLAAAFVFLSQGIPFIQAGQDFLRTKPLPGGAFDHNSYNAPDAVNSIKWERKHTYRKVFDYYKGLIEFRKNHSGLRMTENSEIAESIRFFDRLPSRMIGFSISSDDKLSEMIVFMNPEPYEAELFAFGEYDVYIDGERAGNTPLYTVNGSYKIAPISCMVLGRKRENQEGTL